MRFISADLVFPVTGNPIPNGILITDDKGCIEKLLTEEQYREQDSGFSKVEKLEGWLCPGLVNSHCHLELSYLKGIISQKKGMAEFIRELVSNRFIYSKEVMEQSYKDAEDEMKANGIVAVGDISNSDGTLYIKQQGNLYYHTFIEVIGLDPYEAGTIIDKGNALKKRFMEVPHGSSSIVPHAPYSVSPRLFKLLKESCYVDDEPVCIHMQESIAEIDFINDHKGTMAAVFDELKFDYSKTPAYHARPLKAILPQLADCNRLMLVHNTYTTAEEVQWAHAMHKNIFWTFCPKANLYIEDKLPDIPSFVGENAVITLGTDSLASNDTLNILDEMKVIQQHFTSLTFEMMLQWATINGAKALGIENDFGSFEKGKTPGVILVNNWKAQRIL